MEKARVRAPGQHPTLAELIEGYRAGRSYGKLAEERPGDLSAPRWHTYATGTLQLAPGPDKIRTIAAVLGVSERTVWLAVGASLHLDIPDEAIGIDTDGLPRPLTAAVASLVSDLRDYAAVYHSQ